MPDHPHRTTVALRYETSQRARTVERSLQQEIGEIDDDRSVTQLDRDADQLTLTIDAADLVALRAASNTWLTLVGVAERVAETVDF